MAITTQPGAKSTDLTTLLGTELADSFALDTNNLYVNGLAGSDTVTAAGAVDNLSVFVGAAADSLTFSGEVTNSTINLGKGNDTSSFQDFDGTLFGGQGNDTITVARDSEAGSNLKGGAGNDQITVTQDLLTSKIWGNSDDDTITVTAASTNSFVYGGKQDDTITTSGLVTGGKIRGDNDNDQLNINGKLSGTVIAGGSGNDDINVASASITNTTIFGGKGDDSITMSAAVASAAYVKGDKGDDVIDTASNQKHTLIGGDGNDSIDHTNGTGDKAVLLQGDAGDDRLRIVTTNTAANTIDGGAGKDTIVDLAGSSLLDGGSEDDSITTGNGNDTVYGRAGVDTIVIAAGTGNKNVQAGTGNDIIQLRASTLTSEDTIKGETGTDKIVVDAANGEEDLLDIDFKSVATVEEVELDGELGSANTMTVGANAQAAGIVTYDLTEATGDFIAKIDASAYTSAVGVSLIGSNEQDGANGTTSHLIGGKGADTLDTGLGADTGATDTLTGGAGNDLFLINQRTAIDAQVTDMGGSDNIVIASTANGVEVEVTADLTVASTTANNKAVADGLINIANGIDVDFGLAGGAIGFDISAAANAAASTIKGSAFADSITGGAAADTIIGNNGNDTIAGGVGQDTLTGGTGTDQYTIIQADSETGTGINQITNFVGGTDILDLTVAATGTLNVGSANADLSIDGADVASTGTTATTLLTDLKTAADALAADEYDDAGDTFAVTITGATLLGTGVSYVVQAVAAATTVTAADTIIALTGTSTKALTVATVV